MDLIIFVPCLTNSNAFLNTELLGTKKIIHTHTTSKISKEKYKKKIDITVTI